MLVLLIPALEFLFRFVVKERVGVIILSVLVGHTGWHWMTERGGQLLRYDFSLPVLDAAFAATLLRWLMQDSPLADPGFPPKRGGNETSLHDRPSSWPCPTRLDPNGTLYL